MFFIPVVSLLIYLKLLKNTYLYRLFKLESNNKNSQNLCGSGVYIVKHILLNNTSLERVFDIFQTIEIAIERAKEYLENLSKHMLKNDPYLMAITTYALVLSNSEKKHEFKNRLLAIKKTDGGMFAFHQTPTNVAWCGYVLDGIRKRSVCQCSTNVPNCLNYLKLTQYNRTHKINSCEWHRCFSLSTNK